MTHTRSMKRSDGVYLNGCGSTGEGYKSASSLIFNGWTGGLQQVVDAADKPGTLRGVSVANLTGREDIKAALLVAACRDLTV